jgi:TPR repeat protein
MASKEVAVDPLDELMLNDTANQPISIGGSIGRQMAAEQIALQGLQYDEGNGVEQNKEKALELYSKACDIGYGTICRTVGSRYELGQEGASQDFLKSATYYFKGCNAKDAISCFNLSTQYYDGKGLPEDSVKAAIYSSKACELGEKAACYNLGIFYEYGYGVNKDIAKAKELYKKACELGEKDGCLNAKRL